MQWERRIRRMLFRVALGLGLTGLLLAGMIVTDYRVRSISSEGTGITVEDSIRSVLKIFDWQK